MQSEQAGADVMFKALAQKQKQKVEDKQELFWMDKWNNLGIKWQYQLLNFFFFFLVFTKDLAFQIHNET